MVLILCGIFFISGASALVFETLWFHQAGLAFGNSVWASSLVLSGFMGGLALGSWLALRWGDRLGPPIRAYAALELVIALSGISLVFALPSLGSIADPILKPFFKVPWILNVLRLAFAFTLLLIPSTAMGLTLPLLAKALVTVDHNFGRVLGRLYGWNTFGAVVGALVVEISLLAAFGVRGSAFVAGTMNLVAALTALAVMQRFGHQSGEIPEEDAPSLRWGRSVRWLAAAFLSGFTLLALEVVWFRFLLLYVTGSSVSFSVMLAVVLAGISSGGLFASLWLRSDTGAHRHAFVISLSAGILCTASYGLFRFVVAPFGQSALADIVAVSTASVPLMFPVSFLSGVFFTLVGTALRQSWPSAASTTGILTLSNTAGAALGALVGGYMMLPLAGVEASFLMLALLYGAIGLLVLRRRSTNGRIISAAAVAYVLSLALFPTGSMERHHLFTAVSRWTSTAQWRAIEYREGVSETAIYVEEMLLGRRQFLRLVTNSVSMSSTRFNARRYMKLYVYLPVAVHPGPKTALLISYGVGSTAKAITDTESFESIDVVDISKDILEMTDIVFPDSNENPLNDPRVQVHIEDGRYFLRTTDKSFDLVTGEPPPPQLAEVVNLYTEEYFQLIHDRLNDGGMVTYWLPLHSLSDKSAKAIIKAFCSVFPNASLWHGWRQDVMLLGTKGLPPRPVSATRFERQWEVPEIAAEMKALGIEQPEQLGALFIGESDFLAELTANVPPLVDNFPKRIVADSIPEQGESTLYESLRDTRVARERFASSQLIDRLWPEPLVDRTMPYFDYQRIVDQLIDLAGYPLEKDARDLHDVLTNTELRAPALWFLGAAPDLQGILDDLSQDEATLDLWLYQLGAGAFADREYLDAANIFSQLEEQPSFFAVARLFRIYSLCLGNQIDAARQLADQTYSGHPDIRRWEQWWGLFNEEFDIDPRTAGG